MPKTSISIIITAPHGIGACDFLQHWLKELPAPTEIIVADGSEQYEDQSRGPIRHLHFPKSSLQGLMTDGVRNATGEWVLISEDHCRPLPGILTTYMEQIENTPSADLIAGAVDNLTSRSPWSFAIFSIGLGEFWREACFNPKTATNANLMLRREAVLPHELTVGGGILNLTVPRLSASARFVGCRGAAVDHVVHLSRRTAVDFELRTTKKAVEEYRAIAAPLGPAADAWASFKRFVGCALIVPFRVGRDSRGTSQFRLSALLRVVYVCAGVAWRLALADAGRIVSGVRAGGMVQGTANDSTARVSREGSGERGTRARYSMARQVSRS